MLIEAILSYLFISSLSAEDVATPHHPRWLVNYPPIFYNHSHGHSHELGQLLDASTDRNYNMTIFESSVESLITSRLDVATDGEIIDVLEHFFWGK
jgi:hypothetical protein